MARLFDEGECRIFTGCRSGGYGRVRDHSQTRLTHVVVWEHHNGPVPDGMVVMHGCDNPACCRIDHLSVGTQLENLADKVAKQRHARGERAGGAKLTADDVRAIRRDKRTARDVAVDYGISERYARLVQSGGTWRHVT